jgi:hypothetical protein
MSSMDVAILAVHSVDSQSSDTSIVSLVVAEKRGRPAVCTPLNGSINAKANNSSYSKEEMSHFVPTEAKREERPQKKI